MRDKMIRLFSALLLITLAVPALSQQWEYRLSGTGATNRKGRLEIKIGQNGLWGTVCKDGFDLNDAAVACRSLGINGGASFQGNAFLTYGDPGNIPIARSEFQCNGNERELSSCISGAGASCQHTEDVALECLGFIDVPTTTVAPDFNTLAPITCTNNHQTIRLVDGSSSTEGRVEIRYQNVWGTICDDLWDQNEAKVICRMLCNSETNAQAIIRSQFPSAPDTTKIWLSGVLCNGTETQIDLCPHPGWGTIGTKCTHRKDAGVICAPAGTLPTNPIQPDITCTQSTIIAKLTKSKYPNLVIGDLGLADPGTACKDYQIGEDANEITITIPFVGCNTNKTFNTTHIIYKNKVVRSIPATQGIITRVSKYIVEVSCEVKREKTDRSKLDPTMIEAPPVSSNTEFDVKMFVFDPVTNARTALPAKITMGNTVGIGVELKANDPTLKIVVPDCFASPDLTVTANSKKYPLIQDRCRKDNTITIRVIDQKTMGFTFKIFMFVDGTTPNVNLYVHCTGIVCGINEADSRCDQTCSTRRKRDVTESGYRHKRGLTANLAVVERTEGPFHVVIDAETETEIHDGIIEEKFIGHDDNTNSDTKRKVADGQQGHSSSTTQFNSFLLSQLAALLMAALITFML